MKPEKSVKIEGSIFFLRLRYGDSRPQIVIFFIAVRHHDIQSVDSPALKHCDKDLFLAVRLGGRLGGRKLMQKLGRSRHKAKTGKPNAGRLQKISSVHTTPYIRGLSFRYLRRLAS